MYDKTTPLVSVNELRQALFCKRAKIMENIPPTQVINISSILAYSIIFICICIIFCFFNIRIGQFIKQVSGLEVCKKSKIFHYQKDLVGRTSRDLGSLFGPFYLRWRKQAES